MLGLNRLINIALNFVSFMLFNYGLYSIINSLALFTCSMSTPVGFFSVFCLLFPLFKFLFIRLNTKERTLPEALIRINLRADGRLLHREEKDDGVQ